MKRYFQTIGKTALVVFLLWHMAATALYAIPWPAKDPATTWVRLHVATRTMRYMNTLSLWQQWNMFSPEPLRRISTYAVEQRTPRGWEHIASLDADTYPWWRFAAHFKFYETLFTAGPRYEPIRRNLLLRYCKGKNLPEGTPIRLVERYSIIPYLLENASAAQWRALQTDVASAITAEALCPDARTLAPLQPPQS